MGQLCSRPLPPSPPPNLNLLPPNRFDDTVSNLPKHIQTLKSSLSHDLIRTLHNPSNSLKPSKPGSDAVQPTAASEALDKLLQLSSISHYASIDMSRVLTLLPPSSLSPSLTLSHGFPASSHPSTFLASKPELFETIVKQMHRFLATCYPEMCGYLESRKVRTEEDQTNTAATMSRASEGSASDVATPPCNNSDN